MEEKIKMKWSPAPEARHKSNRRWSFAKRNAEPAGKGQFMSRNICFRWLLLGMALMGVCPLAHGDKEMQFNAVVTNVVDATHVLVDGATGS